MLKSTKISGAVQEVILPDFPDDDETVTTVTKSRRVSFGTNFVKEFIVGSAVSGQFLPEYEQAFPSSDSSNADSGADSGLLERSVFVSHDSHKIHKSGPPLSQPAEPEPVETRPKLSKFSSTVCFSADSPTADMEFTEGCITLAKSILDKKNKEMTVIIQAKPKEPNEEEKGREEETKYFEGSQFDMSMTRCLKTKGNKREEKRFESEKTKIFNKFENEMSLTRCNKIFNEDDSDSSWEDCKENRMPLDMIMRHLDKDNSDLENDLFNSEKTLSNFFSAAHFDLSTDSEALILNESMDISMDLPNVLKASRSAEQIPSPDGSTTERSVVETPLKEKSPEPPAPAPIQIIQSPTARSTSLEMEASPEGEGLNAPDEVLPNDRELTPAVEPTIDGQSNDWTDRMSLDASDDAPMCDIEPEIPPQSEDKSTSSAQDASPDREPTPPPTHSTSPSRAESASPNREPSPELSHPTESKSQSPDKEPSPCRESSPEPPLPPTDSKSSSGNAEASPAREPTGTTENVQRPSPEKEPPLVDLKVIETLKEQSNEPGCVWSLTEFLHPRTNALGFLSFACRLLESSTAIRFTLKSSTDDGLDTCSLVTGSDMSLNEENHFRLPEYQLVVNFGFAELKKYFEERRIQVETIRHVPYFLDQINSYLSKANAHLRQVDSILTSYPGSSLSGSRLSFRLFSFPIFFSSVVSIDMTNLFRLSKSSLSFENHFGRLDEEKIRDIFERCLKLENSLYEFVVQSTKYLVQLERETGFVSKRKHIRLLPPELKW